MVAVTGRAQLQELLRAQEIQLLLLDVELDGRGWGEGIEMIHDIRNMTTIPLLSFRTGCGDCQDHGAECRCR